MKINRLICRLVSVVYLMSFGLTIINILFFFLGAHELVIPFSIRVVVLAPLAMIIGGGWYPIVAIILFSGIVLLSFFNFYKVKKNSFILVLSLLVYLFDLFYISYISYRNNFLMGKMDFTNIPCILSDLFIIILIVIGIIVKRKITKSKKTIE